VFSLLGRELFRAPSYVLVSEDVSCISLAEDRLLWRRWWDLGFSIKRGIPSAAERIL